MSGFVLTPDTGTDRESLIFDVSYVHYLNSLGPSLYWALDSQNGATDLSEHGRDGTGAGGITIGAAGTAPTGLDGATDFDGTNDYITSTYTPFVNGSVRTFMGWAYRDNSATLDHLFGGGAAADQPLLRLAAGSNDVEFWPAAPAGGLTWTNAWPGNAQWVHWALVFDESTNAASLYINGALVSTQTSATPYNATPGAFWIGARGSEGYFDGKQAHVAIFERIATAEEILRLSAPEDFGTTVEVTNTTDYWVEAFEYTPARPKTEWLESADSDGAVPTHEVHWTNAEGTLRVRVNKQESSDAARALISAVIEKAQKARRMVMEGSPGLPVEWSPKGSAKVGTLHLIEADAWSVPMEPGGQESGYFLNMPVFTVHLTFAPGVEMPEEETAETTWATPVGSLEVSPLGELRIPARLTITDLASTARKTVQIGQERYYYNSTSPSDLWLDESELTETTPSNSVADADASGGNAIELLGLFPGWQDVAIRTADTRRGSFKVWTRVKAIADEEEIRVRLKWRVGDGPYTVNPQAAIPAFDTAAYVEVDLGIVTIPTGVANLALIVQAQSDSPTSGAEGVRVDTLSPQPAERTATVEGEEVVAGGQTFSAYDGFNHGALGDALTGTAPESGTGNWAGAGDADDFQLIPLSVPRADRTPTTADADLNTGRYATVGGALTAITLVGHLELAHTGKTTAQETRGGFIVRNPMSGADPDPLNWLGILVRIRRLASGNYKKTLRLYKRVAGTVTLLKEVDVDETKLYAGRGTVIGGIAISVTAAGAVSVATGRSTTEEPTDPVAGLSTTDAVLATAGALASGEAGIYHAADFGSSWMYVYDVAVYSSVSSITQTYAIPSGGRLELNGDGAISYSAPSPGGTAVPVKHRGAGLWLEPAGDEDKPTRLAIKVRDNSNGEAEAVAALARSTKAKISYRPRHLVFPGGT